MLELTPVSHDEPEILSVFESGPQEHDFLLVGLRNVGLVLVVYI